MNEAADHYLDKRTCLRRAGDLISTKSLTSLRYAALELRFCIEAIAYEKLRTYRDRIPPSVLAKWQPPQFMKALAQIEPGSDEDFTLSIGLEPAPGVQPKQMRVLGQHRTFRRGWLSKAYNTLGSVLHVPQPHHAAPPLVRADALREKLKPIHAELDRVCASTVDAALAPVLSFDCPACGLPIVVNQEGAIASGVVECLNIDCAYRFAVDAGEDGEPKFLPLSTDFACLRCQATIHLQNRHAHLGKEFSCSKCGAAHVVAACRYSLRDSPQPESPPPPSPAQ